MMESVRRILGLNKIYQAQAPQQPNEGVSSSRVNTGSQQPTPKEANTHTPTKRSERIAARHERVQHVHHCGGCQTSKGEYYLNYGAFLNKLKIVL